MNIIIGFGSVHLEGKILSRRGLDRGLHESKVFVTGILDVVVCMLLIQCFYSNRSAFLISQ